MTIVVKLVTKKKEMEKLPESALQLIYEYDDTYKEKFKDVMTELRNRMKHRYYQNNKTTKEIYPVTKWFCEISLRRKSKRSKYLIKKSTPLRIYGDVIYPYEHNRNANELSAKRTFQEQQNIRRWNKVVEEYISQTNWLMYVFVKTKGRPLRLLN